MFTFHANVILDRARRIVSEVEQTLNELKTTPALGPKIVVGAIPTVAPFFLPAVLAYCKANDIHLNLHTQEDFTRPLVELLLEGKLDWALLSLPLTEPRLLIEKLYSEPLWLAVGAGHRLATAPSISFADLRDETFIMLGDPSTVASQTQHFCGDNDFEPRIGHRCGQLATVKTFTAMGLGVSVLPQSARSASDPVGLVFRKFTGAAPSRDIALVRHRRRHLGPGAMLFAEAARAVVGPTPLKESVPPIPRVVPPTAG